MKDIFDICHEINNLILENKDVDARNELIKLLDYHETHEIEYTPVVNRLIRNLGLYPYLQTESATWQDRVAYDAFKVDIGEGEAVTLHREQSLLLKRLVCGENLAISAPTSFGKSFVIDAFISIKKPNNVVIIVPTIALTDETRRRLYRKFANEYKIITTTEVELAEKNIFIFPQERAINYVNKIKVIDMLIIDEFYKASPEFDRERSPSLLKAILKLGNISRQKYFLAPNISEINDNLFTKGMEFVSLDFNTVFLEKHELYKEIRGDESAKSRCLLDILDRQQGKSLIYAGTYSNIEKVSNLLIENRGFIKRDLLEQFAIWLTENYDANWLLANLVKRGTGVHNGQLHRSLSQIQIKLFEEPEGLNNIISTSSIIEGVNTSAENVIIWRCRNGRLRLNDFTYKNIIGRGGRMFKHFIGKIYILDDPPTSTDTPLNLEFPDELLCDVDETILSHDLTREQLAKIIAYKDDMSNILGVESFERIINEGNIQTSDSNLIKVIAVNMINKKEEWNGLVYLNSKNVSDWSRLLYKIINLQPGVWDTQYTTFVEFIKVLSQNWCCSIPQLLQLLDRYNVGINDFFKLERNATYKLSALLNDVNVIQKEIFKDDNIDISPFISNISHAFLPSVVYQLEEYGMPRMISKKIQKSGLIDFLDNELTLHRAIEEFNCIGLSQIKSKTPDLNKFDDYILKFFFDGIRVNRDNFLELIFDF